MNTNVVTDYQAQRDAREGFVAKIAKRHRSESLDAMVTEVELTWSGEPYKNLRIFRSVGNEWVMYAHRNTEARALRDLGIKYEIHGDLEYRGETRQDCLGWIALHWGDIIDRMMEAAR